MVRRDKIFSVSCFNIYQSHLLEQRLHLFWGVDFVVDFLDGFSVALVPGTCSVDQASVKLNGDMPASASRWLPI